MMGKLDKGELYGIVVFVALCGIIFTIFERAPPYTFHLFCTYDLTYRLNVTIQAAAEQYSSEVVRQLSRSQDWASGFNDSGCQQTYGTAVSFRLRDDRLVLASSRMCINAHHPPGNTPTRPTSAEGGEGDYVSSEFCVSVALGKRAPLTNRTVGSLPRCAAREARPRAPFCRRFDGLPSARARHGDVDQDGRRTAQG